MTPHLNFQIEMVQIRGHNICLYAEFTEIITKYSLLSTALKIPAFSSVCVCEGWGKGMGEWMGHGYK